MTTIVETCTPSNESLVAQLYPDPDYRDAFLIAQPGHDSVADFATAYFRHQPRWLRLVSMNLSSSAKLRRALGDQRYVEGSNVGSWKVIHRNNNEIVFGDDMGFMEYRFSFFLHPGGAIEASTVVLYKWARASRFYFALVKPMHRRFVPLSLRGCVRANEPSLAPV